MMYVSDTNSEHIVSHAEQDTVHCQQRLHTMHAENNMQTIQLHVYLVQSNFHIMMQAWDKTYHAHSSNMQGKNKIIPAKLPKEHTD
jgi:hypothetical protein